MMAISSGVWAEAVSLETAWNLAEVTPGQDGKRKTMKHELERIGFLGSMPASYRNNPFAAHFELHIEQGPILEEEGRRVGVVKGLNQLTITLRNLVDVFQACKHSNGSALQSLAATRTPALLPFLPAKTLSFAPPN
jgi:hypothetical protein